MEIKKCSNCGNEKEANSVNFIWRYGTNNWRGTCRECYKKRYEIKKQSGYYNKETVEKRKQNKPDNKKSNQNYLKRKNKEQQNKELYCAVKYVNCKDCKKLLCLSQRSRKILCDKCRKQAIINNHERFCKNNPEKISLYSKKYYVKNIKKILENEKNIYYKTLNYQHARSEKYRKEHKEEIKIKRREKTRILLKTNPSFKPTGIV